MRPRRRRESRKPAASASTSAIARRRDPLAHERDVGLDVAQRGGEDDDLLDASPAQHRHARPAERPRG
jgi:hypothetical protein